jgi:hypothetical protein
MRKSVGFFRFFVTLITLASRFDLEQAFEICYMGRMTSPALTVFDRLMDEFLPFDLSDKSGMTITTEFSGSFFQQTRKTRGMGFMAGRTLTFDNWLMPNLPLKRAPVMTIKTVTGKA